MLKKKVIQIGCRMIKHIILSCSLLAVLIGCLYWRSDGLITGVGRNGEKIYSNSLQSSGGDDGSLMAMGFLSFGMSLIASVLAYAGALSTKKLMALYSVNIIVLIFIAFLVSLDVSIVDSITHGDVLLLAGFLVVMVPFLFFSKMRQALPSGPAA